MPDIKCPNCGTIFSVDDTTYASIARQVRDKEFEKELKVLEKNEKILELVAKAKDASGDEKIKLLEEVERIIYSYGI